GRSRSTTGTCRSTKWSTSARSGWEKGRDMRSSLAVLIVALAPLAAMAQSPNPLQKPNREVAVTFDDLPIAGVLSHDVASSRAITSKLLTAITAHRIPAVGF